MLKRFIAIILIALSLTTSCQKNEIADKSVISIGFNAELNKLTKTSGVAGSGLANLQDQDFRVWAYCAYDDNNTEVDEYNTIYDNIRNLAVIHSEPDSWKTGIEYYWPGQKKNLKFFAVSASETFLGPTLSASTSVSIDPGTMLADARMTIKNYEVNSKADEDLMVADFLQQNQGDPVVDLTFRHALSRVEFVFKTLDGENVPEVHVQSLKVKGLATTGNLVIHASSTGEDETLYTTVKEVALSWILTDAKADFTDDWTGAASYPSGIEEAASADNTAMKLNADEQTFATWMVMPQSIVGKKVEITYVIDKHQFTSVFELDTERLKEWAVNQNVKYVVTLAPNLITFTPNIGNWGTSGSIDIGDTNEPQRTDYSLVVEVETNRQSQNAFISNGFENLVFIDYGDGQYGTACSHIYENPGTHIVTFYFSEPLQEIPEFAFFNMGISGIVIPASVTTLGASSLSTPLLKTVTFEEGSVLSRIKDSAFSLSSITEIELPTTVEYIGGCVFGSCKELEQITGGGNKFGNHIGVYCEYLGNYVNEIISLPAASDIEIFQVGGTAFNLRWGAVVYCDNLKRIECALKEIRQYNLVGCSQLEYADLDQVELMETNVLVDCPSLKAVNLSNLRTIGNYCICNNQSLREIYFGSESLKEISGVGSQNPSLEKVTIPSGVTKISNSFNGCTSLATIYCESLNPPTLESSFDKIPDTAVIYVPSDSYDKYLSAAGWSDFASHLQPYNFV